MAILNYTTQIDSYKTVAEIEKILVEHGAQSIMKQYEENKIMSLSFLINTKHGPISVKLPAKVKECQKILEAEKKKGTKGVKTTMEQAERVAWRILKDWLLAQMALLDVNMVCFEEVFMPYITDKTGTSLFERFEQQQYLLESGAEHEVL